MIVSVDLGFGYTKAYSKKKEIVFPSATCPAKENVFTIEGLQSNLGHKIALRTSKSEEAKINKLFIGDLALKEGRGGQFSLNREKFNRSNSLSLILAGIYLTETEGNIDLAVGTPLAYYEQQKNQVRDSLKTKSGVYVSVDNGPEKYINIKDVYVFPQGVGVLFSGESFPKEGLVGIIDIGYHTTDYLLLEIYSKGISPLISYSSSAEVGVHTAQKLFAEKFRERTKKQLTLDEVQYNWDKAVITYKGEPIEISSMKKIAVLDAGTAILDTVESAWSEKIEFLDAMYLAGGGALEFQDSICNNYAGNPLIVSNPQFANAIGFYKMTQRMLLGGCGAVAN
jgi:plasmid segregation protein ParM